MRAPSTACLSACLLTALACSGDEPARVEQGLLGCPRIQSCVLVAVSQTVDERVELYAARAIMGVGPPGYRGALDLDLVPNPGGDIGGDTLDEPYGLAWDGAELHVVLGHYPSPEIGSLLSVPAAGLADYAWGELVPRTDWFDTDSGAATGALGERLVSLGHQEVHGLLAHPGSDALLLSVFANDLFAQPQQWQSPSAVLDLSPPASSGEANARETALGCAGAWDIAALDDAGDAIAVACDGDERVVILDAAGLSEGRAPSVRCTGMSAFSLKQVRELAPDGLGGVLLVETPHVVSATEVSRVWWFDGDCGLRGVSELSGALSWTINDIVAAPGPAPRWWVARGLTELRGVIPLAGDPATGSVEPCGRLEELDETGAWVAETLQDLEPLGLALTRDGRGLAITTGPTSYADAAPGYGSLWWAELGLGLDENGDEDSCAAQVERLVELGATAPPVDPDDPQTWRRAPELVTLIELPGLPP